MNGITRHHRILWSAAAVSMLACPLGSPIRAQSTWEVTPYRTQVWWVAGTQPNLPASWQATFASQLETRLRTVFRAACDADVGPAPEAIQFELRRQLADVSRERIFEAEPSLLKMDKLFLVVVEGLHMSYRVRVRELDCRLGHWGPIDEAAVAHLSLLAARATQLMEDAFSPLVRIDRTSDQQAHVRLRARALLRGPDAPGALQPGDLLLPFDRRIGTSSGTRLQDIRAVDWTYLRLPNRLPPEGPLPAKIVSGYRQPFRSRRSRRQEQLAIRARPTSDHSTIRLQSRAKHPAPLVGYEIHEKGSQTTEFLGYTDYRGELTIPASSQPIRILLVRSGDRVTAKLPVVPGLRPLIVASMLDDRQRVETDGFLSGIQTALVDLVARRESLSARIRRRIADGELDEATRLLKSFRDLPTQSDFRQQIQQQQQALNVTDPKLRKRIDTMFVDTYRTLGEYLDGGRLRQLEKELAAARGGRED